MTLEKNLQALAARRSNSRKKSSEVIETILSISRDRTQKAQALGAGSTDSLRAAGVASGSGTPTKASVVGHYQGDGHNHAGGSVPSAKEAEEVWSRVQKLTQASSAAGHRITPGARTRDYATQVRLYNAYKAGRGPQAAKPGTSKHGNGRANDLQYGNDAARQWALSNAKKFGLHMPIYNPKLSRSRDESWHVELYNG